MIRKRIRVKLLRIDYRYRHFVDNEDDASPTVAVINGLNFQALEGGVYNKRRRGRVSYV